MRDGQIMAMQQRTGQAIAARDSLLLAQFEFLRTRQEAFERVLKVSTLRDRIGWALFPLDLLKVVDVVQLSLLQQAQKSLAEAAAKPHIIKAGNA